MKNLYLFPDVFSLLSARFVFGSLEGGEGGQKKDIGLEGLAEMQGEAEKMGKGLVEVGRGLIDAEKGYLNIKTKAAEQVGKLVVKGHSAAVDAAERLIENVVDKVLARDRQIQELLQTPRGANGLLPDNVALEARKLILLNEVERRRETGQHVGYDLSLLDDFGYKILTRWDSIDKPPSDMNPIGAFKQSMVENGKFREAVDAANRILKQHGLKPYSSPL